MKNVIEFILEKRCPEDICFEWTKRKSEGCILSRQPIEQQPNGAVKNEHCSKCWANVEKKLQEEKDEKPIDLREVKREKAREKLTGQLKRSGLMEGKDE